MLSPNSDNKTNDLIYTKMSITYSLKLLLCTPKLIQDSEWTLKMWCTFCDTPSVLLKNSLSVSLLIVYFLVFKFIENQPKSLERLSYILLFTPRPNISQDCGTFITTADEPCMLVQSPQFRLRDVLMYCTFYGFEKWILLHTHHCSITQKNFTALYSFSPFPAHLSPATRKHWLFYCLWT